MCIGKASHLGDITIILNDRCFPEQWMAAIKNLEVTTVMNPFEWDSYSNQLTLYARAAYHGCNFVFFADDDMSFPLLTREKLHDMAAGMDDEVAISFPLREMWNQKQYRNDGIWAEKRWVGLRKNPLMQQQVSWDVQHLQKLHANCVEIGEIRQDQNYQVFHWGMSTPELRQKRYEKYAKLDPEEKYQKQGYRYLTSEENIQLVEI